MEAIVKTRKVGGSIMVRIPPEVIEMEQLQPDEIIRIDIHKMRQDYFGRFKGVGRFTAEDELNTHD